MQLVFFLRGLTLHGGPSVLHFHWGLKSQIYSLDKIFMGVYSLRFTWGDLQSAAAGTFGLQSYMSTGDICNSGNVIDRKRKIMQAGWKPLPTLSRCSGQVRHAQA
jgi:hypothetical protein